MPRQDKAQIVFKNRIECQEFYDKNLKMLYGKGQKTSANARYFPCRRRGLGFNKETQTHNPNYGYIDCPSTFRMSPVFKQDTKDLQIVPLDERPHYIFGVFYHNHENDGRFHRFDGTGAPRKWKCYNSSPSTTKTKKQIKSYYIPKKKRLELGLESNFKSKILCDNLAASGKIKIRGRPKKNKTKATSISHELQLEVLKTKEAL